MIRRDADTGRAVPPDRAGTRFPAAATALEPLDILESAGRGVIALLDHAAGLARLLGELVFAFALLPARVRLIPWREISANIHRAGVQALAITGLVGC